MQNKLTEKIMQEIGLEIDTDNNYIIDQDNGYHLHFNGKHIKCTTEENYFVGRNEIEFDPINNPKLMNHLFGYYTNKIHDEGGVCVNIYYPVENRDTNKGYIELKDDKNNTIKSKEYYNDSLKYADLIFQLNGEEDVDLTEYDAKKPITKK